MSQNGRFANVNLSWGLDGKVAHTIYEFAGAANFDRDDCLRFVAVILFANEITKCNAFSLDKYLRYLYYEVMTGNWTLLPINLVIKGTAIISLYRKENQGNLDIIHTFHPKISFFDGLTKDNDVQWAIFSLCHNFLCHAFETAVDEKAALKLRCYTILVMYDYLVPYPDNKDLRMQNVRDLSMMLYPNWSKLKITNEALEIMRVQMDEWFKINNLE